MPIKSELIDVDVPCISFHEMIFSEMRRYGNEIALVNNDTDETFTFEDILLKTKYIANSLLAMGIEKDEMRWQIMDSTSRFAFVVPHALNNVSTVFAELNIDHRVICIGNRQVSKGFPILNDLALTAARCSSTYPEMMPEEDIVFLPYSTGTSGPRKGVAITHSVLNAMLKTFNNHGEFILSSALFHDTFGRDVLFSSLLNGATMVTFTDDVKTLAKCIHVYKKIVKVIDMVSGAEVGMNEQGLILLRGQTVVSPYWKNDKATFEDFERNGWRNTGDIGFYDKDGNVFLVDREKQMIKVDGFQVTPQELESILLTHPSIAEAAIVPATKVNQQEIPVAFVVLKPRVPATAEQIKEFINERVMRHKQVDVVVIAMTLPRSPGGKILWRLLREAANRYT
uniref:BMA-ACS-12 n=1 Tax=Brugia malayi TaxID=6279 RepID=A0A0J9XZT9_BRUMA|nr:BMA-ACS-12 [Brugia malayi]